ncbi:MAG: nucleoside deaminase [Holosporales bacterium]|jgi:tRNA(adenine34) deaminase|nr:nucleoside deaminase [Holosporales bacterium]
MVFFTRYMQMAINEAQKALQKEAIPVGAVIVDGASQRVVARAHNEGVEDLTALPLPLRHAEIVALTQASISLCCPRLDGCDLYTTLEPCHMCFAAISLMRVRRVVFGAYSPQQGAISNGTNVGLNSVPSVIGGIMEDECGELLKAFFKGKRDQHTSL